MSKLSTGFVKYSNEFDSTLEWKIVPISGDRRFPFRVSVNVSGRSLTMAFRMNPIPVLLNEASSVEHRRLVVKILDEDNNNEVLFEDAVVERQMFQISDVFLYFLELTLKEENMLASGDFGGSIRMGMARESDT